MRVYDTLLFGEWKFCVGILNFVIITFLFGVNLCGINEKGHGHMVVSFDFE